MGKNTDSEILTSMLTYYRPLPISDERNYSNEPRTREEMRNYFPRNRSSRYLFYVILEKNKRRNAISLCELYTRLNSFTSGCKRAKTQFGVRV